MKDGPEKRLGTDPVVGKTEKLYFRLLLKGLGLDPRRFRFWKFAHQQGERIRVRVFGPGSAAVYDVAETESWSSRFADDLQSGLFDLNSQALLSADTLEAYLMLVNTVRTAGLVACLETLNRRVPHRFTAVYKLAGGMVSNIVLVDKENAVDTFALQTVPLTHSFCSFALKDGPRAVGSYVSVPIPGESEGLYGLLCHFDFEERTIPDQEFYLLEHIAQILPPHVAQAERDPQRRRS
jgi:hypothetical protein